MNDPHVEALNYRVEHGPNVDYKKAEPLAYDTPVFAVRIAGGRARFEIKGHYATEGAARDVVEPFIRAWEVATGLDQGPNRFALVFETCEVVDRDPSPGVNIQVPLSRIVFTGHVPDLHLSYGNYPEPAASLTVSSEVELMYHRYMLYREGRDLLSSMANFCLNVLEWSAKGHQRSAASKQFHIDRAVLKTLDDLVALKGGREARKAKGISHDFTALEKQWIDVAVRTIIRRAAEVAYDPSQKLPQISLSDLPPLSHPSCPSA